jgi:uncharacterized protein with PIN domain/molybdopterin converting factor small subunit
MVSATFRFYDGLNDFLARDATTKHMIEALGVPHTEVELILVNGVSAGLDTPIEEGDRIAIYPRFAGIGIGEGARIATRPPGRLRFAADAHLGGLARLLRMAGFDTTYDNGIDDGVLVERALEEGRIVLSRDRELLKRRGVEYGAYVRALKPQDQLRELFERFELAERARPFTLCLHCNAPLRIASKDEVLARLPPMVRALQHEFSTCDLCRRVYWKGSHWKRMAGMLDAVGAGDEPEED